MTCTKCGETKAPELFKKSGEGRTRTCKACMVKSAVAWQRQNRARARRNRDKWRLANPVKMTAARTAWTKANPEKRA